jgi:hypothetical protein
MATPGPVSAGEPAVRPGGVCRRAGRAAGTWWGSPGPASAGKPASKVEPRDNSYWQQTNGFDCGIYAWFAMEVRETLVPGILGPAKPSILLREYEVF